MIDALHACFGIPPDAPAHVVVGVAPDAPRAEVLERATERLRAVHARFMEDDPAFIAARARLRAAARELVDRPGTRMEADDLRALVASSGGWNATARTRALRWAAMHGIDPATLVELLGGPSAPASGPVATTPSSNERRERERSWLPWAIGAMAALLALAATATLTLAVLDRGTHDPAPAKPAPAPAAPDEPAPPAAPSPVPGVPTARAPEPREPSIPSTPPPEATRSPQGAGAASTDWDQLRLRFDGSRLSTGVGIDAELALLERMQALTEAALLLEAGRQADARLILDGMPETFRAPEPAAHRRRAVGDGGLATAIDRADGPEARVLALNRWLGSADEIGPIDARTLAELACGPDDGLSRRARSVAQSRFASSADMAVGWLDALTVADAARASSAIGAWLGRAGLDATSVDGAVRVRQALVERAIALVQGEADSMRQRVAACQASWERMAPLLNAVPARGAEGDLGTASIQAIVQGSMGTPQARALAELRMRAADHEVARFLAWQTALLDALAEPSEGLSRQGRFAARSALDAVADARASASSSIEQAIANQRAITTAIAVRAGRWTW